MKQDNSLIMILAAVAFLAAITIFFTIIVLVQIGGTDRTAIEVRDEQLSLADRIGTIDPAYLTRPPTAGPSPTHTSTATSLPSAGQYTPQAEETRIEPITHTVAAGENLYRISLAYGVTVDSILSANGLSNPQIIQPGQILIIPIKTTDATELELRENPINSAEPSPTKTVPASPTPLPPTATPIPPTATALLLPPTETATPIPTVPTTINGVPLESFLVMSDNVIRNSRAIFLAGQSMGRNPMAYSKVGDSTIENPHFMARFDEGNYNLGDYAYLQAVIDQFSGSHSRQGVAVRRGNHSWTVTDPMWADKSFCQPNETMIACEIRIHNPSIILIRLGSNDRGVPAGFQQNLRQVVQITIDHGVIPVLATKADRFEGSNINNDIIRQTAADFQIPLWDFDLLAGTIPGRGLDVDAVHLTTFYAHDYTSPTAFQRGHGVHNLSALMVLDAIWKQIIEKPNG